MVEAARKVQPLWALLRVQDRARYMRRVAQAVIDEFDELLELLGREQGRPRAEVASMELLPAIDALIWIADEGARVLGSRRIGVHRSMAPAKRARVAYEPYGVVGVIGAGSAPFAQPLGQIAGALLAGNAVTFKPARRACLAGERIARVLGARGAAGGPRADRARRHRRSASRWRAHRSTSCCSPARRRSGGPVARACVSQEKEVTVELGGKDAMLVLRRRARRARGQRGALGGLRGRRAGAGIDRADLCRARALRALPHAPRGVARARCAVGDPERAGVQMGPLASPRRLEHVRELVDDAVAQGARLHCGGPPEPTPEGCAENAAFYAPAVLSGVTHAMRVMREPLDGPVLAVMSVESHRPRDRAGQRLRLRSGSVGVDRRSPPRTADRARAARRAWCGSTTICRRPPSRAARGARRPAAAWGARSARPACAPARRRS